METTNNNQGGGCSVVIFIIACIIALIFALTSCTAVKNGYTEGYRRKELQKAVVITKCEKWLNRYKYEYKTIPSGLVFQFEEFDTVYNVNDTIMIDREFYCKYYNSVP